MKEQNRKLFYQIVAHLFDIDEKAEIINEDSYWINIRTKAKYNPSIKEFGISKLDEGRIILYEVSSNINTFYGDFTIKSIGELNVLLNIISHTR